MKKFYLPFFAFAMLAASCGNAPKGLVSGIDVNNLDTTMAPGTDFYQYACGGWMKAHPLTDQYGRYGSFDMLAENNTKQIRSLIEEIASSTAGLSGASLQIKTLYNVAMDSVKLNNDGYAPIAQYIERINSVKGNDELPALVADMIREGFGPYMMVYVSVDEKNSAVNSVQITQSGLTLGNRDYYLSDDENNRAIREKYLVHVANMFKLAGVEKSAAEKAASNVMEVETALARAHYDNLKLRVPQENYHMMPVKQLQSDIPQISWNDMLADLGFGEVSDINVCQPEPVKAAAEMMKSGNLDAQKDYLKWKVIKNAAPYLSDEFVAENFEFDGKVISGLKEMKPRWKRSVGVVDNVLGEAVGKMYVEKYFPAEAKDRMITLVSNLKEALGQRIQALEWMSDSTKARALDKLSTFYVKVGYPDTWRDYSALEIKDDSYFANIVRSNEFEYAYMVAKAGKPVDKTEWLMTPQTVNAYYNPTTNEICFPAGILQYPFFDMNADDAFNYGAIGVVIGHEMTHGFDDQGRQYDKDGNLQDWWTAEDADNFNRRAQVLVDWFDAIEVLPGLKANGKLTLGENIADYGGLQVAFTAFRNATKNVQLPVKDGFTPEQRFYLAYANLWAGNIREEQIRLLTTVDVHSLGRNRVNATLPHIPGWYDAFGITENDTMYLAPEKRAYIW